MRFARRLSFLIATLLLSGLAMAQQIEVYHAYWMGDVWRQYDLRKFHRILFFNLVPDNDGHLADTHGWPQRWTDLHQQAAAAGTPVVPVVTVMGGDLFHAIFGTPSARSRLLQECVDLARAGDGLHLDLELFEPVPPGDADSFDAFLTALRAALDEPPRKPLSAFVPAGDLYSAAQLANFDEIVAQAYDVHWIDSAQAGPVSLLEGDSPAALAPAAAKLVAAGVPRERIFFSSPLYGYEWPVVSDQPGAATRGKARIVTYAPVSADQLPDLRVNALSRVVQFGLRREPQSGAPWYALSEADGWWQGWFDDAGSLGRRLEFVRNGKFGGVAFFVLGYDGGALVETARAAFKARSADAAGARPPAGRQ
ncbi:MAG TPA: glycosyl hydrolase family 18 protein [Rhodocyclaceae bacterium]